MGYTLYIEVGVPGTLCDSHPFRLGEDVGFVWAVLW